MSKIFELFGYPIESWNKEASANCAQARCPFMDSECDGGGNRYLSAIDLNTNKELSKYFPGKNLVQAGVCSLRPKAGEQPWIVCPRRLLSLRTGQPHHQSSTLQALIDSTELPRGKSYRAWCEVKMKVATENEDEESKYFDYTFDYVLSGFCRKRLTDVATLLEKPESKTKAIAELNGYTLAQRNGDIWIEDFPSDPITIVEIMTSSTSGGDKKKRTQIAMAFEDAVRNGLNHNGPGINYRQVWARMVSQLIVKSQVGIAWKGKTVWLVQDVLADYISQSTALNLEKYLSERPNEVNILALGYGKNSESKKTNGSIIELKDSKFYSGPISGTKTSETGFIDIVKIGAPPPKDKLWKSLFLKRSCATLKT